MNRVSLQIHMLSLILNSDILLQPTSYLYSITDLGFYKNSITDKLNNAYGLGGGYRFKLNNNFVDLGYVIGNNSNNQLKLNKSKLIIKWTSYF